MNTKPTLAIIGCGWLGQQFIPHAQAHYCLSATTSTQDLPIPAYPYRWQSDDLPPALQVSDHYLIALPPSAGGKEQYAANMQRLIRQLPHRARILMISSTSVYPQAAGKYDEQSPVIADHPICLAENAARTHPKTTIVRSGGQYGADRIPLPKATPLPDKRLNLISGNNLCRALLALLRTPNSIGKTYNLVEPDHPWRSEFSAQYIENPPTFLPSTEPQRLIDGTRITLDTDFVYFS